MLCSSWIVREEGIESRVCTITGFGPCFTCGGLTRSPLVLAKEETLATARNKGVIMSGRQTMCAVIALAIVMAGCSELERQGGAIMQAAPGDPAGSASIGTGSVTMLGGIPPEAKSAGIGLAP